MEDLKVLCITLLSLTGTGKKVLMMFQMPSNPNGLGIRNVELQYSRSLIDQ